MQRSKVHARVATTWSKPARQEYSRAADSSTPAQIGATAKRAARATLEYLQQNHNQALSRFQPAHKFALDISIIGEDEMTDLNSSYRGKNKPTDVLSFAQTEGDAFPECLDSTLVLLGDVVVAISVAMRQADELRHSLEREVAFLTVHGTLHLCGFDHDTSSRRRTMWNLQDAIVDSLFAPSSSSVCSSH